MIAAVSGSAFQDGGAQSRQRGSWENHSLNTVFREDFLKEFWVFASFFLLQKQPQQCFFLFKDLPPPEYFSSAVIFCRLL